MEILRLDPLEGVKLWMPDLHIYELREDEELLSAGKSGLERGEEASDVSLSSAGDDQASEVYKVQSKKCDFLRIIVRQSLTPLAILTSSPFSDSKNYVPMLRFCSAIEP